MIESEQYLTREVIQVATSVTEGGADLLWACRRIVGLQHLLTKVPESILDPIRAVESELDGFPDETDTLHWGSNALEQLRRERDEYLERVRPTLLECFQALQTFLSSRVRT